MVPPSPDGCWRLFSFVHEDSIRQLPSYQAVLELRFAVLHRPSSGTGEVRWRSSTNSGLPQTFGGTNVVLAGDLVVFGDSYVHAFDRTTGERRWTFTGPIPRRLPEGRQDSFDSPMTARISSQDPRLAARMR